MQLNIKKMKKIIIIVLFLFVSHANAQNIVPVEKSVDYVSAGNGVPVGTYLKDVNNLFAPYLGTWKGTIGNKTYTLFVSKITESSNGRIVDKLIIYHVVFDSNLGVVEDTRSGKGRPHMTGWFFSSNLTSYSLHYVGENSKCGRSGQVIIKKIDAGTMSMVLSPRAEVFDPKSCPGGQITEQILPTETPVTLIKL